MGVLEVRIPQQVARGLTTQVLVADRTIIVGLAGRLTGSDAAGLVDTLAEALELCCGVVVVDVTACRCTGDAVVTAIRDAAQRARQARCDVRVVTADGEIAIALDTATIS
ncbi:hypothetical protein ACFWNN_39365 [Lentzea sp. NPDC058450]|uniref:hypothetical protein n=1 Tax=Lentzea sp. NPDC058450 TaxID=3346505 RepID=UPI003650CF51